MALYIPFPQGYIPPSPPAFDPQASGLTLNKKLTHWFIQQDPTQVKLIPRVRQSQGNGSFSMVDGTARDLQVVKIIFISGDTSGIVPTQDGQDRQFDFTMVGEWNATVAIDDYWIDENSGQKYVITAITPFNGYEVKATGKTFGTVPLNA